jgi:hypothetical protein
MSPTCPPHVPHLSPTCPPPVPHLQPADNNGYRARFTVRPPGHGKREIYRKTTRTAGKKIDLRQTTDGRETREIYHGTTRPRNTREICRGTTRQTQQRRRRVETTAFSHSAFRIICSRFWAGAWPGRGSFTWGNARKMCNLHGGTACLHGGTLGKCGIYMGERLRGA